MSEIDVYQFPNTGQQIRTLVRQGEPWFSALDVCAALGLDRHRDIMSGLDEDEKVREIVAGTLVDLVSEAGLYSVILRSRKPEAKAFKRWVTHEVLPAIRRTGAYGAPTIPDMSTAAGRLQILDMAMQAERRALQAETRVKELEPDAARARRTLDADGLSLVGTVAKRFGIKERALREFLYAEGLLIRGGARHNEPMARHVQAGHFEVKTSLIEINPDRPPEAKSTTYVTPRGEALIWKRLHEAGYVASARMPGTQLELV